MNYHHIVILGRATQDAEQVTTPNDKEFVKFTVAVNERRNEEEEKVTYYECLTFGETGNRVLESIRKGNTITIHGRPSIDAYLDGSGKPKPSITILVQDWYNADHQPPKKKKK